MPPLPPNRVGASAAARALAPAVLTAAVLLVGLGPAGAESETDARARLRAVEANAQASESRAKVLRNKASELAESARRGRRALVELAREVQEQESTLAGLDREIADLADHEARVARKIAGNRESSARVLMALQRVARRPSEALIVDAATPVETVRSAILLRSVVPRLEARVDRLRQEMADLKKTRRALVARRAERTDMAGVLAGQRKRLESLIEDYATGSSEARIAGAAAAERANDLAREAADLRDLLGRLDTQRRDREAREREARKTRQRVPREAGAVPPPPPAAQRPIAESRGSLPFPAVGRIVGQYGQRTGPGMTRKGLLLRTVDGAQVIAPYGGRVVYAGPFRGYGLLLIIEHGAGYHTLLAGMARVDVAIGQWVVAGEPVATMGAATSEPPELYVELRRNGQPINPLPWLANRKGKVNG